MCSSEEVLVLLHHPSVPQQPTPMMNSGTKPRRSVDFEEPVEHCCSSTFSRQLPAFMSAIIGRRRRMRTQQLVVNNVDRPLSFCNKRLTSALRTTKVPVRPELFVPLTVA